jgi:phosphate transport system substrate-binding protein
VALRSRVLLAAAVVVPLVLATACSGGGNAVVPLAATGQTGSIPSGPASGPQSISENGSSLLYPLMQKWAAAYQQQHPNVKISTGKLGSKLGIAKAAAGTVDIGGSDAYLPSAILVQHPTLLNIPLAISAQQVNYNVPGLRPSVHLKLSPKVLVGMYDGTIKTWNNSLIRTLNPGVPLPNIPVVPVHRLDGSGDTFLFTSYLSTEFSAWSRSYGYGTTVAWPRVPLARTATGNSGMLATCHQVKGCVAYIGIAYLTQATTQEGLGYAQLQNKAKAWELPSAAAITAAVTPFVSTTPANETISMVNGPATTGYPIVNYEYAVVSTRQPNAAKARDIKAFLHWAITQGNSPLYLNKVQFQHLPPSIASLSDAQIAKIG